MALLIYYRPPVPVVVVVVVVAPATHCQSCCPRCGAAIGRRAHTNHHTNSTAPPPPPLHLHANSRHHMPLIPQHVFTAPRPSPTPSQEDVCGIRSSRRLVRNRETPSADPTPAVAFPVRPLRSAPRVLFALIAHDPLRRGRVGGRFLLACITSHYLHCSTLH